MSISSQYIPMFNLNEAYLDKVTGLPLVGGVVTFYDDAQRELEKPVYQITGTSPNYSFAQLTNPLILSNNGTFVDTFDNPIVPYAYPYDSEGNERRYYVTFYNSDGVFQFDREAVPYIPESGSTPSQSVLSGNQIANPQFVEVLFDPTTTRIFSVTGSLTETAVAPDWTLVTTGTGTVTVSRVNNVPVGTDTNPPFALSITSSGISLLRLRQRLTQSPRLFANDFVSAFFMASSSGGVVNLILKYEPSTGSSYTIANGTTFDDGSYQPIFSTTNINGTINTDTGTVGYVDFVLDIPVASTVNVTSFQLVSVNEADVENIVFEEESTARQIDHLFHYYKPLIQQKRNESWLVGWDFPTNPAQFGTSIAAAGGANTSRYMWDQTIVYQSAASGVSANVATSGSLTLTAAATTQMAVIQYLGYIEARELLNNPLCVNLAAIASNSTVVTISLWYTTDVSLPALGTATPTSSGTSLVTALSASGKPSGFSGTWTEVPRGNLGDATFTVAASTNTQFIDYPFSGWNLGNIAAVNTATYFAIVIGTASMAAGRTLTINSCSLQNGSMPTRPAPKSWDATLLDSQYYFEKSYFTGDAPGAVVARNSRWAAQAVDFKTLLPRAFSLEYQEKRNTPTIKFYSPTSGTVDFVRGILYNGFSPATSADVAISVWTETAKGARSAYYAATSSVVAPVFVPAPVAPEGFLTYHFTCDARLGVV